MNTRYTSNLQKGGALLEASASFVSTWDETGSAEANLRTFTDANSAASPTRRRDLVNRILRPRFMDPGPHLIGALKVLLAEDRGAFREACYFETSRTEPLLADFVEGPVFDWHTAGRSQISVPDARRWLVELFEQEQIVAWSEDVQKRVAQALLSSLRDFGILRGASGGSRKEIAHPYPTTAGFAYACWRLGEMGVTAASLEGSPVWRRWLLSPPDVSALIAALAGQGVIMLNRAGSVTRIEWQAATLVEAVHAAA